MHKKFTADLVFNGVYDAFAVDQSNNDQGDKQDDIFDHDFPPQYMV
jgi:hypothetical protein